MKTTLSTVQLNNLSAYMPLTLVNRVLADGLPLPGEPRLQAAAALFSDISGFTGMSEELASDGPRGAEELNRVLLTTFTAMIDVIHALGGSVSHFYGDAMSVYFPDEDGRAAQRALACAQLMQRLMLTSFDRVVTNRPSDKDPFFQLTIKIGVGYGTCQELLVGDAASNLEFVLTGTAVDEAAAAEKGAKSGQVMASHAVLTQAGLEAEADFTLFNPSQFETPVQWPPLNLAEYDPIAQTRLADVAPAFIHPALGRRLLAGSADSLAEHRPVTSLFVQFAFVGDDDPSSAIETAVMGRQLHDYYNWACGVVARFGQENGRVNRVLTGDKGNQLHIMFGAPVAPDAPEQAIRCALVLQREKPDFIAAQKIGLAAGKVFAAPVGSAMRCEYTVVGDVVNLSARLMQICPDGLIYTNRAAAERARQWLSFEQRPPVQVKGKQIAVTPFVPTGERLTTTQLRSYVGRWQRPLVGRDEERTALMGVMNQALAGRGQALALSGPTGVGKSRLMAVGIEHWLAYEGLGLLGVCYQHTADMPFSPWRAVWQAFFGLAPGMSLRSQVTAVMNQTLDLLPDCGDDLGLWAAALNLPIPQAASLANLTAEARQARLFALVRRCFVARSVRQPLLILLEGLHWADQASLTLLDELSGHLAEVAMIICIAYRPDTDLALSLLDNPICTQIEIAELSPLEARQLLLDLVGASELPPAVEQHLGLRDRDGRDSPVNPLFLEEAVRVMESAGVLQHNGRMRVNETLLGQVQVPDTIHGLLLARLDKLPVVERDLLQVASVIGRQFAAEPLTVLSSEPSQRLIVEMLDDLTEVEMTRLVTADPDWIFLFQHAMTHEVAYESLPFARRQMLHALIADWLLEESGENIRSLHAVLAYHFGRAGNDKKGLEYALKAAHDARDIFANREAIDLYTQAENHLLAMGEEDLWETAVELYLARANVKMSSGDLNGAYEDARQTVEQAAHHNAHNYLAEAYNLMAEIRYRQGRLEEVHIFTNRVLLDLRDHANPDQLARSYIWAGWAAASQLDYVTALDYLHDGERICQEVENNYLLARVLEAVSFVRYSQKELELSLRAMQQCVQLSREFSTPINLGTALNNVGFVQFTLGRYDEAVRTYDEAVLIGRDSGRNLLVMALANRAAAQSRLGDFPKALQDFEEVVGLLDIMNYPSLKVETYLFWTFEYSSVLGEWDAVQEKLARVEEIISQQPESYFEENARLLIGWGQLRLHQDEVQQAIDFLERALELIHEKELLWWEPIAYYFLGLALMVLNQREKARLQLLAGLQSASDLGCPDYKPLLLLALAKLEPPGKEQRNILQRCLLAAELRARYADRMICFREAGAILASYDDPSSQQLGRNYLARVA
ncbi:MAG: AAA family ATPase [Chloroflexi bacterium]|nr:AAA family ATPase [Chloroflexota bacterium]